MQTAVGSSTTCCTDLQRINSISEDNEGDELPQDTLKPTEKLGLRDMDYICTMCSDDMLYEDSNIVDSHGEFQDHTSTEYEVDKNTDISKNLVFDTTHAKIPYSCDTVNVSTPDPTITVQNTEHASEKASISNCQKNTNVRKQQKDISIRPKSDKEEIIVTQKIIMLNLENEVKQLKAAVNTMTAETSRNSNTNNYQDNRHCANTTTRDSLYDPNDHQITWIRNELLEQRIRISETQMMQNMCISTALNTHLTLQSH